MGNTSAIPCSILGDTLDLGQDNQDIPTCKSDITAPLLWKGKDMKEIVLVSFGQLSQNTDTEKTHFGLQGQETSQGPWLPFPAQSSGYTGDPVSRAVTPCTREGTHTAAPAMTGPPQCH